MSQYFTSKHSGSLSPICLIISEACKDCGQVYFSVKFVPPAVQRLFESFGSDNYLAS
jgi:hypothetical protein